MLSCRTLFHAAMGAYDYNGMGDKEVSYSILQMIHVYLANIILLNLLIAILTEIMELVGEKSTFKYLVNLYTYCERYMIAFENENFGEIVIHPPPINFLSAFLVPMVLLKKEYTAKICKAFSYGIYWIENCIFILVFLLGSFLMIPFAYAKAFTNIYKGTPMLKLKLIYFLAWIFSGFFFLFFMAVRDCKILFKILTMHSGCRHAYGLVDEESEIHIDKDLKLKLYNEMRETVIEMFIKIRKDKGGDDSLDHYVINNTLNDMKLLEIFEEEESTYEEDIF